MLLLLSAPRTPACDTIGGCAGNELATSGLGGARAPSIAATRLTGAFTIELWFRSQSPSAQGLFGNARNGNPGLTITTDSAGRIVLTARAAQGDGAQVTTRRGFLDGAWHHLVARRNASTLDVLVDESFHGSTLFPDSASLSGTDDLTIGAVDSSLGLPGFSGRIDEVRLWNVALDSATLACRRFDRLTGTEPNLVAYYPFDDSTNRTVTCDRSPNANDATLGPGATIALSTRPVPPPIIAVQDSLAFPDPLPCDDTTVAIARFRAMHPCGASIRSLSVIGPDSALVVLPAVPPPAGEGDTISIVVRVALLDRAVHATLVVRAAGCPDPVTVALTAPAAPRPRIRHDRDTLAFPETTLGTSSADSLHVFNVGALPDTIDCTIAGGPFELASPTMLVVGPGTTDTIRVTFAPTRAMRETGTLILQTRRCPATSSIVLLGTGLAPGSVTVCADSLTIGSGDTTDLRLSFTTSAPLAAQDRLSVRLRYDARQIALLGVGGTCGTAALVDAPGDTATATLTLAPCVGLDSGTIATLRLVGLAPDSITTTLDIAARRANDTFALSRCTTRITVVPACDDATRYAPVATTAATLAPAPVTDRATLTFRLNEVARARVMLFDVYGRRIATLCDRGMRPGVHAVTIDAAALVLLPGTYFVTIDAGTLHAVARMPVVR